MDRAGFPEGLMMIESCRLGTEYDMNTAVGSGVLPDLCILLCKIYVCMCVYSNQYNKKKRRK